MSSAGEPGGAPPRPLWPGSDGAGGGPGTAESGRGDRTLTLPAPFALPTPSAPPAAAPVDAAAEPGHATARGHRAATAVARPAHRLPAAAAPSTAAGTFTGPSPTPDRSPAPRAEVGQPLTSAAFDALAPIPHAAAGALAAQFAADFLTWDEDDLQARLHALACHLANPGAAVLGSTGRGRQEVDLIIPGAVAELNPRTLVVQVTARVVLHERHADTTSRHGPLVGDRHLSPAPPGVPDAAAGAPGSGPWVPTRKAWTTLDVPVTRSPSGRLEVDPHAAARALSPGGHR